MRARVSGGGKVRVAVGSWLGRMSRRYRKKQILGGGLESHQGIQQSDGAMQGRLRHGDVRGERVMRLRLRKARLGQFGHGLREYAEDSHKLSADRL